MVVAIAQTIVRQLCDVMLRLPDVPRMRVIEAVLITDWEQKVGIEPQMPIQECKCSE